MTMPEDPCINPACTEEMDDYTIGTFECRLLLEGADEGDEFVLGNVVIATVRDGGETFPSYDPNPLSDVRYLVEYRDTMVVRVAIDTINPRTVNVAFNTTPAAVPGGYNLVFEALARMGVWRVTMDHEVSCRDALIRVRLPRASIAVPTEIPWSMDGPASMELEFHALLAPDASEPLGYLALTGDFHTSTI